MNKLISILLAGGLVAGLTGCDNLLEDNSQPLTQQTDSKKFWNSTSNVQKQIDFMYQYFEASYATSGTYYWTTHNDDQCNQGFTNWYNTANSSNSGSWSDPYYAIRHIEYILTGLEGSTIAPGTKNNFLGIARLMRAYEYFQLVKRYGDVVWVDEVVDVDSEVLYGPRISRDIVMDNVLEDLNFAVANITTTSNKYGWSNDLAQAIKSDICLWEGTFCQYRTAADNGYGPDPSRAQKFLNECVTASAALINSGRYSLAPTYREAYNSVRTTLANNPQIIMMNAYQENVKSNYIINYTRSSTPIIGINKNMFDAYLFIDGKPKALTSEDNTDAGIGTENDYGPTISIENLLEVRDGRLAQTVDPYVYYQNLSTVVDESMPMTSATGYGVSKFDNTSGVFTRAQRINGPSWTCCPAYQLSTVMCNYSEAKAELGTLTDADLDMSVNKLFARAGLPATTVAEMSNMNDPANNMGVSSLIWEIRRNRRCELVMDNNFRYWDLVRWHQLRLMCVDVNPDIWLGANVTNAPVDPETGEQMLPPMVTNGYLDPSVNYGGNKLTEDQVSRQYRWPIPPTQIALNENLTQNPGW